MVGHIVVWAVGYHNVGLKGSHHLHDFVPLCQIVAHEQIADVAGDHFDARERPRAFGLGETYFTQFAGLDYHVAHVPVCHMADCDIVTLFFVFCQSSGAAHFDVVRMAAYGKNIHDLKSPLY
jgi:hypothetical protein